MSTADEFMAKTVNYWQGYFSFIDEDTPDGAWWALHEQGFADGMDDCCDMLDVTQPDCDENDLMHAYLHAIGD